MKPLARIVLRVGIALAFAWVGIMILRSPSVWFSMVQPWARYIVRASMRGPVMAVGVLDVLIAVGLLFEGTVWMASVLGSVLLLLTLVVTGITDITVNYVGILAAVVAIALDARLPRFLRKSA